MHANPIEEKFLAYEAEGKSGLIVEIPMLAPIPETQRRMANLLIEADIDVIQIPIPIRFPWMYGMRILKIQKLAAENNIWYEQSFLVLEQLIHEHPGSEFMPVGFYGGLQRMGQEAYVRRCAELGIHSVDVPDYPLVHDHDPHGFYILLANHGIDYTTVISTELALQPEGVAGYSQLAEVVRRSYGFSFLLATAGGKTGEVAAVDYGLLDRAARAVRSVQKRVDRRCPLVAVCGISTPEQVRRLTQLGLHVMFGSALFTRMMNGQSDEEILEFLISMKQAARMKDGPWIKR